jgi:hypothetical protein
MMQIPFFTDDRLEVAVRQVLRHVHPVPGGHVLISNDSVRTISIRIQHFDFEIVVDDNTVVLFILNH